MSWIITFFFSWIVFLILVDLKTLKTNLWGGFIALGFASLVDWGGQKLGLYKFYYLIYTWVDCSVFYVWGPIFSMGIIFLQYIPNNKFLKIAHILVFSILFGVAESSIIHSGAAKYIHWHLFASLFINTLVFTTMTWIKDTLLT